MSLDQERAGSRPTLGLVEGKQSAHNSAVECHPYKVKVVGSNPTGRTIGLQIKEATMHICMHEIQAMMFAIPVIGYACKCVACWLRGIDNE